MKRIVCIVLMSIAVFTTFAQEVYSSSGKPVDEKKEKPEEEKGFNRDKLIFGGGFIFGIGGGVTNLGLSPVVGYRFTDRFSAGVGLGYQYLRINDLTVSVQSVSGNYAKPYDYKESLYTSSVWSRFVIWQNLFAHIEPEMNLINSLDYLVEDGVDFKEVRSTTLFPRLLAGGGLRQPISDRVSFLVMGLYDVLGDPKSPFNRLSFRVGIVAGF